MIALVLSSLAAFASMLAAGDLVAGLLRPSISSAPGGLAGRAGLAFLLGPCVVAWLLFVANLAGVPISTWSCRALAALFAAAFVARTLARSAPRPTIAPAPRDGVRARAIDSILIALIVLPVLVGIAFAVATPPVKDALVNWSLKVKLLFEDGTVRSEDLRASQRYLFHPNYPMLVPLAEVFVCGVVGEVVDGIAKVVLAFAHFGAALVVLGGLLPSVGRRGALVAAALVAAIPHFYRSDVLYRFAGSVPSGYADPMFAGLAAGVSVAVVRWFDSRARRDLVLVALLLGFALFTKNEGQPLLAAILAGAALGAWRDRSSVPLRERVSGLLPAVFLLAAIAAPWFLFRGELPARDENYQDLLRSGALVEKLWRVPIIVQCAIQEALAVDRHGFTWPLLAVALIAAILTRNGGATRLRGPEVTLAATIAAMACVYAAVFVVTPLAIIDSLVTSIPRTFFHVDAVAIVLAARLLAPREVAS